MMFCEISDSVIPTQEESPSGRVDTPRGDSSSQTVDWGALWTHCVIGMTVAVYGLGGLAFGGDFLLGALE